MDAELSASRRVACLQMRTIPGRRGRSAKEPAVGIMRRSVAVAFLVGLAGTGSAQEECTTCKQNYTYICMQNYGDCTEACNGIGTTDKDACKRRCHQNDGECLRRASAKCGTCWPGQLAIPPPRHIQ